jgi:murein hydrolase activator
MKKARVLFLSFLLFSGPAGVSAVPRAQDVADFEKRIEKINAQIRDLKEKIKAEEGRESTILSALSRIGLAKNLIRKEIAANAVALERANGEMKGLKTEIAGRKTRLEAERAAVGKTLVTLYKFGKFEPFQFVLQAGNLETLISESKHLTILARHQQDAIAKFMTDLAGLGEAEGRLKAKSGELAGLIRASETKAGELEREEANNRDLVAEVRRTKKSFAQALDEYAESAKQLQILMKKIIDREYTLPFPFVPLYEKKGALPWPIQGKIITPFGLQKHPQFNTITLNNGVEIVPKKGETSIKAIHPGRVVYADAFEGYGNLIIIDHGMTYYSLYGHCSEFLVAMADTVKAGQPIALVGDSGSLRGECLYFELRFKTKALDPLQWLRRR